ncbi:hypothetical protein [Candidatus Odyssella thessalonicensis]|uniref:hypothetical protein n=1 Tax=Candidatus Odyssella thessalonicensis TaxID=84647 RepID=UPI000225BECF|nr:hypothetical protein [Candidatus Odyssella thessalonicensis]
MKTRFTPLAIFTLSLLMGEGHALPYKDISMRSGQQGAPNVGAFASDSIRSGQGMLGSPNQRKMDNNRGMLGNAEPEHGGIHSTHLGLDEEDGSYDSEDGWIMPEAEEEGSYSFGDDWLDGDVINLDDDPSWAGNATKRATASYAAPLGEHPSKVSRVKNFVKGKMESAADRLRGNRAAPAQSRLEQEPWERDEDEYGWNQMDDLDLDTGADMSNVAGNAAAAMASHSAAQASHLGRVKGFVQGKVERAANWVPGRLPATAQPTPAQQPWEQNPQNNSVLKPQDYNKIRPQAMRDVAGLSVYGMASNSPAQPSKVAQARNFVKGHLESAGGRLIGRQAVQPIQNQDPWDQEYKSGPLLKPQDYSKLNPASMRDTAGLTAAGMASPSTLDADQPAKESRFSRVRNFVKDKAKGAVNRVRGKNSSAAQPMPAQPQGQQDYEDRYSVDPQAFGDFAPAARSNDAGLAVRSMASHYPVTMDQQDLDSPKKPSRFARAKNFVKGKAKGAVDRIRGKQSNFEEIDADQYTQSLSVTPPASDARSRVYRNPRSSYELD